MPVQENQQLIQFLNKELSNFQVLYVKLHRYHWYIQGTLFFELHAKFEEWYEETASAWDEIAERILAINGKPLATMAMFLQETSLKEAQADDEPSEMIRTLYDDCKLVTQEIKSTGIKLCEQQGDVATADLLTRLLFGLEKRMWMLRAMLADKKFTAIPEPVQI